MSVENGSQSERIVPFAEALVSAIERSLPRRSATPERFAEMFAAAGLARGADLLGAAVACLRAGRGDPVGVLVRSALDTWFVSLYLFTGGPSALAALEHEFQRNQRVMAQRIGISAVDPLLEARRSDLLQTAVDMGLLEDGDTFPRLSVERVAAELAKLEIDGLDAVQRYELLYRSFSTFDAHGLGPIARRIEASDAEALALQDVELWMAPQDSIGVVALILGEFAVDVLGAFGVETNEIAAIQAALEPIMWEAADGLLDGAPQEVKDLLSP